MTTIELARADTLTRYDKEALRAYLTLYTPHRAQVLEHVRRLAASLDGIEVLFGLRNDDESAGLEHRAIFDDDWKSFLDHLRVRGEAYARAAVPYTTWFRMSSLLRDRIFQLIQDNVPVVDIDRVAQLSRGTHLFFDIALETLGRAYFEMKEQRAIGDREQAREALRASEEQLQHSQKMDAIGQLASNVAHDFNNILAIVQTSACLLEDSLDASDDRRVDAVQIRRASERAANLTRQLLTLGRKSVAVPEPVLIDQLVAAFLPNLRRLLGPGVILDVQLGRVPPVVADPGQLEQVVMNLAVNARDAMQAKGTLHIETSTVDLDLDTGAMHRLAPGRYVVLAVTDTGPGIGEDILKRIFEPFFTTKPEGKGTGLGLSIAHGIVTQAGGSLDVYSEPGHGTTFRIRLPTSVDTIVVPIETPARVVRKLRPVTVLFVDHQSELRALVSRVLHADGCTVLEAASGAEARAMCVSHDGMIDVAVLDVTLSDGRGDLLARELRELRPQLKVLLMSGFPTAAIGPSGEAPAEVLAKPFTPARLREAIASVTSDHLQARISEPNLQSRVLLVDDDPTLRRMLKRLLTRAGFDIVDVDSGRDAFAELAKRRFDVILSDIHMPGGDGLELLRSVRRIDLDIPVILMSGKPDVKTAATALEFGAFRYLSKPLESEAVEKVVRHAARAHALARIRREAMTLGGTGRVTTADRAGLEVRFDAALEKLWMAFQPIVEARTGELFGVEALMRSREPSIPTPPALLDAATQLRRLPSLGRHTRQLSATAVAARPDIPSLFMNLHPEDLLDINLVDESAPLTQIASRVILEVTERESLDMTAALVARLERLRELGFRIAVDDIGAGYSGLTSFTDLTPEIVKIDMSLVRSIHTSTVKQRTVGALCRLCHEMGTLVVGEGVETTDERDILVELGCDLLQGYLIAKPTAELPAESRSAERSQSS